MVLTGAYGAVRGVGGYAIRRLVSGGTKTSLMNGYNFIKNGGEITFKNSKTRIAPFGNRPKVNPTFAKKAPHYHRQRVNPQTGQVKPGQGISRHRPWETKSTDKSFWDRF